MTMRDDQSQDTTIRHLCADGGKVRIEVVDVLAGQRAAFAAAPEDREEFARERVAEPLRPWDDIGCGMGYRIVRSFLDPTGMSAVDATYLPWREIAAGSLWLREG
jgi:hypothetical protein